MLDLFYIWECGGGASTKTVGIHEKGNASSGGEYTVSPKVYIIVNQEADTVCFSHLEFKLSDGYGYVWDRIGASILGLCCMMFMAIEAL
jgi:hypothetical protein